MEKNDSFKKKELYKKDYEDMDNAAKVAKGVAGAVGAAVIIPTLIKGVLSLGKKLIFKA